MKAYIGYMILKKKKLSQNDHTQRDRVFSSLALLSYFLWGIKEVYKLLCWTWILADFSFLQHYTPSHEHVAPHQSWQMKQLGNIQMQSETVIDGRFFSENWFMMWFFIIWDVYKSLDRWDHMLFVTVYYVVLWLECLYIGFAAFHHFLFFIFPPLHLMVNWFPVR